MHFGTLYLERQTVPGRGDAPVNANDAITKAINSLGGGQGGKVPEQGQPVPGEETRRCNRPGCETPHADVRRYASGMKCVNHNPEAEGAAVRAAARQEPSMSDADLLNALSSGFPEVEAGAAAILRGETEGFPDDAEDQGDEEELPPDGEDQPADADPWDEPLPPQTPALTGAEKARAILLNEAAGQAFHLGISRDKHLETLLPPGTQPDAVTPSRLRTFIVGQRVPVTKALRGKGQATMADAYASLGKDVTEDALRILAGEVDGN
jgi:hypothetical protein